MYTVSHDPSGRKFTTEVDGNRAQLDYTVKGGVMTITHTRVPQAIESRGIAAQLMSAAVQVAHLEHWSIDPVCSYAAAYLKKHPLAASQQHTDGLLDEGLKESFPACDPPCVGGNT